MELGAFKVSYRNILGGGIVVCQQKITRGCDITGFTTVQQGYYERVRGILEALIVNVEGGTMRIEIPVWQKVNLTLEEAAAYYNIGVNKLREITDRQECEKYVLWVGNRRLIKRTAFETYLQGEYSI